MRSSNSQIKYEWYGQCHNNEEEFKTVSQKKQSNHSQDGKHLHNFFTCQFVSTINPVISILRSQASLGERAAYIVPYYR